MQRLITILFCFLLFSCHGQEKSSISKTSSQADTTTLFKKEIPTYKNGEVDLFYQLKKQKEKQLKLDSLESGFDSLEIRIWYDYALLINRELIVIKRANGKWSAEKYEMVVHTKNKELIYPEELQKKIHK